MERNSQVVLWTRSSGPAVPQFQSRAGWPRVRFLLKGPPVEQKTRASLAAKKKGEGRLGGTVGYMPDSWFLLGS